ncbi:MAG: hypothetical protein R3E98_14490 [Gemmatimonadota bacterium]
MKRKTWISWHRWAAGIGGALLISLSITGLWYPLQNYVPALRGLVPEQPVAEVLDVGRVAFSPLDAAQLATRDMAEGTDVRSILLTVMGGYPVYDVRTSNGRRILRADTGDRLELTREEAEALVRARYGLEGRELVYERLQSRTLAYWGDVGFPAHVFHEPSRPSTVYAVSPTDGRLDAATRMSRISQFLMRAHVFWPIEEFSHRQVQRAVLFGSGLFCLVLGISGYFLLFPLRFGRKKAGSRARSRTGTGTAA